MQRIFHTLAIMSLMFSTSVFSEEHKNLKLLEHVGSDSPHVHGAAELNIVLEARQLFMELHSPAINLLGFEHSASSPEQLSIMENTLIKLANTDALFLINGGKCKLKQRSERFPPALKTDENLDADDHNHHPKGNHISNSNPHSDVEATYQYTCNKPDKLRSITINLRKVFPDITSLQVQWIAHGQQGLTTLNHEHNEIHFR